MSLWLAGVGWDVVSEFCLLLGLFWGGFKILNFTIFWGFGNLQVFFFFFFFSFFFFFFWWEGGGGGGITFKTDYSVLLG